MEPYQALPLQVRADLGTAVNIFYLPSAEPIGLVSNLRPRYRPMQSIVKKQPESASLIR